MDRDDAVTPQAVAGSSIATLADAIQAAAAATSASIALEGKRAAENLQRHLAPAVSWLTARMGREGSDPSDGEVPILAQEYIDRLRSRLVHELSGRRPLEAREVVRVFELLEALSDAWKRTDRGKFMARLTGSESASAVVAIAHDIRSPLSSILILVDALRRGPGAVSNPIQERQLGLIYGATQGLATLASDLIDAARGAQILEGAPRPFSIAETMESVCAIVQPIAEEKGLQLHFEHPVSDARLGHATQLHRALLNLTSNALRYTDSGSVTLGCREISSDRLEFWVQDTGDGLPLAVQQTLFDAFRPEHIALRFSSSGLGLATVRALVSAMGGALRVDTSPGCGTRISFDLDLPRGPH